ncbi:MAG: hypothetical protein J0H88_16040 [Sphingomonadales bacterium]|nr:hypothetical protein [Sphingomonadales bacterium]
MTVTKILGWVIALALGIGVGVSSYGISNETRAPLKALATGMPPSGIASANAALSSFAARRAQNQRVGVNAYELRLARDAYRAEPLAASAIALHALSRTGKVETERQWSLIELAGKLTRRSLLVNISIVEAAARRRDDRKSFAWISRTMLTQSNAAMAYGKAMAAATARDGAVEALTGVLGPSPRWSDLYWQLVLGQPDSYVNASRLRIALARAPWKQTGIEPTDRDLVRVLANVGKFDEAQQLAHTLRPVDIARGNLLTNGYFSADPSFPPFDWELSTLGNLGASIDKGNKQLVISAISGASGSAVRQLVRLTPGNYRLKWSMTSNAPLPKSAISARIVCKEQTGTDALSFMTPLGAGRRHVNVKIPEGACRWYLLTIDVALPDDAMGVDIVITELSLTPAS